MILVGPLLMQKRHRNRKGKVEVRADVRRSQKKLYPNCEDGYKKLGSTLELLQWKAENGVSDKGFEKLLTIEESTSKE